MAGSYGHLRDDDSGYFRFDLIENLRDAYQACEECFFLIERLSGGDHAKITAALEEFYDAAHGRPVAADVTQAYAKLRYGRRNPFPEIIRERVEEDERRHG
jgi:hypothetical protein